MTLSSTRTLICLGLCLLGLGSLSSAHDVKKGRAILARKILIAARPGPSVLDNGVILISGARIEAVGPRSEIEIPEGYEVLDVGDNWVGPGFLDLHNHTASDLRSLNDTVYLTNPGLRAWAGAIPDNAGMRVALAAGVTSVLTIPGSGSNMGGQGVLQRTGSRGFEANLIRNPGSLKLAQAGIMRRNHPVIKLATSWDQGSEVGTR